MFNKGQIVFSKSGRDKGNAFVIFSVEGEYIYLVDGDLRKVAKPKKKKQKHIQPTKNISDDLKQKLDNGEIILDSDVRKALAVYMERGKC